MKTRGDDKEDRKQPSRFERICLAAMAVLAIVAFGLSLSLSPDPSGFGTHTALGLSPCKKYAETGWPCLTCGMTTSFALAARLQLGEALKCQPFGALLFLAVMAAGAGGLRLLLRGESLLPWIKKVPPLTYPAAVFIVFMLLIAAWTFKAREPISHWLCRVCGAVAADVSEIEKGSDHE